MCIQSHLCESYTHVNLLHVLFTLLSCELFFELNSNKTNG